MAVFLLLLLSLHQNLALHPLVLSPSSSFLAPAPFFLEIRVDLHNVAGTLDRGVLLVRRRHRGYAPRSRRTPAPHQAATAADACRRRHAARQLLQLLLLRRRRTLRRPHRAQQRADVDDVSRHRDRRVHLPCRRRRRHGRRGGRDRGAARRHGRVRRQARVVREALQRCLGVGGLLPRRRRRRRHRRDVHRRVEHVVRGRRCRRRRRRSGRPTALERRGAVLPRRRRPPRVHRRTGRHRRRHRRRRSRGGGGGGSTAAATSLRQLVQQRELLGDDTILQVRRRRLHLLLPRRASSSPHRRTTATTPFLPVQQGPQKLQQCVDLQALPVGVRVRLGQPARRRGGVGRRRRGAQACVPQRANLGAQARNLVVAGRHLPVLHLHRVRQHCDDLVPRQHLFVLLQQRCPCLQQLGVRLAQLVLEQRKLRVQLPQLQLRHRRSGGRRAAAAAASYRSIRACSEVAEAAGRKRRRDVLGGRGGGLVRVGEGAVGRRAGGTGGEVLLLVLGSSRGGVVLVLVLVLVVAVGGGHGRVGGVRGGAGCRLLYLDGGQTLVGTVGVKTLLVFVKVDVDVEVHLPMKYRYC
eukprot:Rhum_TRINITY_DN14099_c4_g1::Rhum_TRINITY_DN14099_c4_g1_i1::g.67720::m.67720